MKENGGTFTIAESENEEKIEPLGEENIDKNIYEIVPIYNIVFAQIEEITKEIHGKVKEKFLELEDDLQKVDENILNRIEFIRSRFPKVDSPENA